MARSSTRHNRETHGWDAADETPADHGEVYSKPDPDAPDPDPSP